MSLGLSLFLFYISFLVFSAKTISASLLFLFYCRNFHTATSIFLCNSTPGTIAKIASALEKIGANIISIGNLDSIQGESTIIMKVSGVDKEKLGEVLKPMINSLIDIREA